jgi:undecaprenyl-diphosphatase
MTLWQAIVLGVVQGVTEFLPISSSGHLVIAQHLFGLREEQLALTVFLHFGTLLAIVVVFRNDIVAVLTVQRRLIGLVLLGSIPAAVVGIAFHRQIEQAFASVLVVGVALLVTGLLLTLAERSRQLLRAAVGEAERTDLDHIRPLDALLIGLAQAVAILPGISRSGSTISAALLCGLNRDAAARFSFLLAIPALGGAALLELRAVAGTGQLAWPVGAVVAGVASAFLSGVASLKLLLAVLRQRRLLIFAAYCFILGTTVIAWQLWR